MDLSDAKALQQQIDELRLQIDRSTRDAIESAAPAIAPKADNDETTDPAEDIELVNTLWMLKAGFQEAESLIALESMESAVQSLDRLETKVKEFDATFPHTLLGIDIARHATQLHTHIRVFVAERWDRMVEISSDGVRFTDDDKADEIVALYPSTDSAIVAVGRLIDRLLDLNVGEVKCEDGLILGAGKLTDLEAFSGAVEKVTTYLSTVPPPALARAIVRRHKAHLMSEILRRSLPKLVPTNLSALPRFKQQLLSLEKLEKRLSELGWTKSSELSHYVASFNSIWPSLRRGQFMGRLRHLYKSVAPIETFECRRKLITPSMEGSKEAAADDWAWNEEDTEEFAGDGAVVELWREYTAELGVQSPEQFFTMYRAITPAVYEKNSLWLYADTLAFIGHAGDQAYEALSPFANLHLYSYVHHHAMALDTNLLPQLFGNKQGKAMNQLKTHVGSVAEEANAEGGPELREMVLGQLVEQIVAYVVTYIEALGDIGDKESSKLAGIIAKLDYLAVFFSDVRLAVPSWYKMEMLGRILMGNLATIQEMHTHHELADFSASELEQLLKALFIDSSTRQSLIREFYDKEDS